MQTSRLQGKKVNKMDYLFIQPGLPSRRTKQESEADDGEERKDGEAESGVVAGREQEAGLFYMPGMEELPDFDLPSDLELPNIATDLQALFTNYDKFLR